MRMLEKDPGKRISAKDIVDISSIGWSVAAAVSGQGKEEKQPAQPDVKPKPVQTFWWTGTSIDLHNLRPENLTQLATLASTRHEFYKKYVHPQRRHAALSADLVKVLSTTEAYANQFAEYILHCFEQAGIPPADQLVGQALTNLHVKNVNFKTTLEHFREVFESVGTVVDAHLVTSKTGRRLGYGFVTMATPEQAEAAIRTLNQSTLDDRVIEVQYAKKK